MKMLLLIKNNFIGIIMISILVIAVYFANEGEMKRKLEYKYIVITEYNKYYTNSKVDENGCIKTNRALVCGTFNVVDY